MTALLRSGAPRTPPYVVLFVTARCNARCLTCFYWREAGQQKRELTVEEVRRMAPSFRRLIYLTLTGGEPFLREDLPEIARAFIEQSGTRFVSIPTNGLLSERIADGFARMAAEFPRVLFRAGLSVDGIGPDHDRIRGVEGGFARLEETFRLLDGLRRRHANLTVDVTTVCNRFNQESIETVLAWVDGHWRPDNHNLLLARGDSRDPSATEVPVARYRELAEHLRRRERAKAPRGLRHRALRAVKFRTRQVVCEVREAQRMVVPCRAGRSLLVVTEEGDVRPCEMRAGALGSLREAGYDVTRVLGSPGARDVLRRIDAGECWCTYECAIQSSILFRPREYPGLLRGLW
jgi:MoaA/NifB/PqqE/SkfB family radical SAM enzyme